MSKVKKDDVTRAQVRAAVAAYGKPIATLGDARTVAATLNESEHNVAASVVGLKPIKGKNRNFTYPDGLSYGGRSWTKEQSGAERWKDDKLDGMNYKDNYGNILKVVNEGNTLRVIGERDNPFKIKGRLNEDEKDDKPEVAKCIYCHDKPVDPKHDPYCSNHCAINAERDNQDD